jgi:adenylate kinase
LSPGKNVFIFIGPPGSGKGTLSHLCVKALGWVQLSTGNLCRKHIAEQTEIGKQIDFALKSGKLVSDSLINDMVHDWFATTVQESDNIILDGYPRTVAQAEALHDFLNKKMPEVAVQVVRFFVSDDVVINRICSRLVCLNKDCQEVYSSSPGSRQSKRAMICDVCSSQLGRRNDDEMSSAIDRLQTYHKHEQELINFYRRAHLTIKEFEVERPLVQVFDDFKKVIGPVGL